MDYIFAFIIYEIKPNLTWVCLHHFSMRFFILSYETMILLTYIQGLLLHNQV